MKTDEKRKTGKCVCEKTCKEVYALAVKWDPSKTHRPWTPERCKDCAQFTEVKI